jgi:ankyrin repeat protein
MTLDLNEAAQQGELARAKELLAAGAAVNAADADSKTPLHLAAAEGHYEVMQLLLTAVLMFM